MTSIVFLGGVPPQTPGLLFKVFQQLAGVKVYYQPFRPNLDLFAKYSLALRGDPGVPAGYFDSYTAEPDLLSHYPYALKAEPFTEAWWQSFQLFLTACIESAQRDCGLNGVVFEISGFEVLLPDLLRHWSAAKAILLDRLPEGCRTLDATALWIKRDRFIQDYLESVQEVLWFCGFLDLVQPEILPTSDWLKLCYSASELEPLHADLVPHSPYQSDLDRHSLNKLLVQREFMVKLGRQEVEINSLKTQIEGVHRAAEDRLAVIQRLDAEVKRLKAANSTPNSPISEQQ
jgi:hypothetical protein